MKKRMISILLCCCMIISLLPTAALAAPNVWDGTTATYDWYDGQSSSYTINSASDLKGFANIVSGTDNQTADDFAGETVNLAADIDLNNQEWTPIGGQSTSGPYFKGTFDGQGHTIKSLKVTSNLQYSGLFSVTRGATIQNLTVDGINITYNGTDNSFAGAIVGYGMMTYITNCGVKNGSINVSDGSSTIYIGGITGRIAGTSNTKYITYCYNYEVEVAAETTYIGSIAGDAFKLYVASCYAYVTSQADAPLNITGRGSKSYCVRLSTSSDNDSSQRQLTVADFADGTAVVQLNKYSGDLTWSQGSGEYGLPVIGVGNSTLIEINLGGGVKMNIEDLEQESDGTYIIKNALEWVAFANKVLNEGSASTHPALNAKVEKDAVIDFSTVPGWENGIPEASVPYVMIGYASQAQHNYAGTFDGNGCTVEGFKFNNVACSVALFGGITNGGTVKNITIEDISITTTDDGGQTTNVDAAGIVIHLNGGTVENCHIKGGTITSDGGSAAGIAADVWKNQANTVKTNTIKNCTNSATITATGAGINSSAWAGGISGAVSTGATVTIEDCHNTGAITSEVNCAGGIYAGWTDANAFTIKRCTNTGAVSGGSFAGGIAGYGTGTYVLGGDANNNDASTIENCWNWGDVTATGTSAGIVPTEFKTTVQNCYSIAQNVTYGAAPTNAIANSYALDDTYTEARFNSGEIAYKLHNGTNGDIWGQEIGKDDYPIFNGKEVVQISFVMVTGESGTAPDPCYTNAGKTLAQYPTSTTALYEFYSDEAGQTPLNTETKTYDTDTTVYVKVMPMQASVSDQEIAGYTGIALNKTITVTLFGAEFNDTMSGNWITNLPAGLSQSVAKVSATEATITISGSPTAVGSGTLTITVPENDTNGGKALTCTGTVSYSIVEPTYVLTLDGMPGSFAELTYGYTTGSAVTYTFKNTGNQPLTGISASITAGDNAFAVTTAPDTAVAVGGEVTVTVTSKTGLDVSGSPYTGTLTLTWENNSTGVTQPLSQIVNAATGGVTITSDISKTYDGNAVSAPTYDKVGAGTVTIEYKVKNTDDSTYTEIAPTDVGEYTVRVSVAASGNYAAASVTRDFAISPKTIEIIWTEDNFTYNGTDQKNSVTAYYLDVNSQQIALAVSAPAGFKDYKAEGYEFSVAFANGETNYVLPSDVTKTYHIKQAAQSKPEGVAGVDTSFVDLNDGKLTGVTDKMEYKLSTADSYTAISGTVVENLAAGTYYVRYAADDNHTASDYVEVTINKGGLRNAALAFAAGLNLNKTYDGNAVVFTNSNYTYVGDGQVTIKWYSDNNGSKGAELSGAPVEAGTYYVGISASEGETYKAVDEITMTFTIAKKDITGATIKLGEPLIYTGSEQTQTVTSVVIDGLTVTYTISGNTATNVSKTGYTLTITGTGNFEGTETATWNIAQQTGKTAATATTVQYFDTAEKTVDIAALIADLKLENDTPVYAISSQGNEITTAQMNSGSLKFQLVTGLTGASELTNTIVIEVTGLTNYDKVTVTVTVTITPYKPVDVDMSGITLNSKVYDGQDLTYSGEAAGSKDEPVAFIYEWYKKDVSGDYVLMTGTPKDAGDYRLKATVNTDGYSGSDVKDVTILKVAVTVRPESFEITVGDRVPTLTLMYAGLIGNETITPDVEPIFAITDARGNAVTLENAVRSAGTYTITWSNAATTSFSDSDNYTVTKIETAILKVNSRPIIIPTYYTLNFVENGGTTIKNVTASYGVTIDLSKYTTTRTGYIFDGWYSDVRLTNEITSVRLTKNTTVYAGWTKIEEPAEDCDGGVNCPSKKFTDVDQSQWYHEAVDYVIIHNLMNGTSLTTFEPLTTTNRAMIVTILYRLEGQPNVDELANPFTDLSQDWYKDAVKWAAANGIVEGYGNGKYGPEDAITREQLAAILYRYAQYKGYDVSVGEDTNILSYNDAFEISEWAIPAMQWAVGEGIMQGYNGYLTPVGSSKRCEAAAMLMRFIEGNKE